MNNEEIARIKKEYPVGNRIRLISMTDDPRPIAAGEEGTVACVDDIGSIHVNWDNGRSLAVIPGVDTFCRIEKKDGGEEDEY